MSNIFHNSNSILEGILFVIAIIAGIGPQNLNIINHAIKRNHTISVSSTCFISDTLLILFGAIGLSLADFHIIILVINIIGIIFLSWYLFTKINNLFNKSSEFRTDNNLLTRRQSIFRALALTWLNPLVLIDTIVIIGGNTVRHTSVDRINFIIGAIIGDAIWIYGLTILINIFSNKLNKIWIWRLLDILTIIVMTIVLYKTFLYVIQK
jgi:L-lysine exporter family protein LysE/ArgO